MCLVDIYDKSKSNCRNTYQKILEPTVFNCKEYNNYYHNLVGNKCSSACELNVNNEMGTYFIFPGMMPPTKLTRCFASQLIMPARSSKEHKKSTLK